MAWNFRKRVKVAPGVTLNFSKNGVSTTIGPKGANINISKSGVYGNAGIPGTGLYKREKISGKRTKSKTTLAYGSARSSENNIDPESVSTKEAVIGVLSLVVGIIVGLIVGIKCEAPFWGCIIAILPVSLSLIYSKSKAK